jgi:hypothetical protein
MLTTGTAMIVTQSDESCIKKIKIPVVAQTFWFSDPIKTMHTACVLNKQRAL